MTKAPKETSEHVIGQFEAVKPIAKVLGFFSKDIGNAFAKLESQLETVTAMQAASDVFVAKYSTNGWCRHDNSPANLIVEIAPMPMEEGEQRLIEYYLDPNTIERIGYRFNTTAYLPWQKLFAISAERLAALDYVSAIPLLLMIADGICTDATGKNAFSGGADAPVFDSLASKPGGLADGLKLLGAVKRKVITDQTTLPFRHGILHGLTTNYDNPITAAKAVNLLAASIDYFDRKRDEEARIEKAAEEQATPSFSDLGRSLVRNSKIKAALDAWERRPTIEGEIANSDHSSNLAEGSPEATACIYLSYLMAKNFGGLAELTIDYPQRPINYRAGRLAKYLSAVVINGWHITKIEDVAAAVSVVGVEIIGTTEGLEWKIEDNARLIYSDDNNGPLPRGLAVGAWLAMPKLLTDIQFGHIRAPLVAK